jgi:predicted MFS family arabinose efflux permease
MAVSELLRRRGLAALLASEIVSMSGTAMTLVALPWFVLSTTGSPARTSVVMAAAAAGLAVCGIPGGWVAGRLGARRAMLVSNALRAPLIALIPFLHGLGELRFWMLPLVAFAVEAHTAPYQGAQLAVMADLAGDEPAVLAQATALYQAAQRASNLIGPAFAGVLIALVGASEILWIDAGTYAAALGLTSLVPAAARVALETEDLDRLGDGVRFLGRDVFLRFCVPMAAVWEGAAAAILVVLFPIIAYQRYNHDSRVAGALLAGMGAGAIVGSVIAYRIILRFRPITLGSVSALAQVLPFWVLLFRVPVVVAVGAIFVSGIFQPISYAPAFSYMTLRIPASLRSTVMAALGTIISSANPLGVIVAGPLVVSLGLTATVGVFVFVLTLASLLYVVVGPRVAGEV